MMPPRLIELVQANAMPGGVMVAMTMAVLGAMLGTMPVMAEPVQDLSLIHI